MKAAAESYDAVETVLIEAVRRCLEGKVRHVFVHEFGKHRMQRNRVGRRQRAVDGAAGLHDADRSDRGGVMTERGKNLPREICDRRLAARAGDRNGAMRLLLSKLRGDLRQCGTRVFDLDQHDAGRHGDALAFGDDNRFGTARDRIGDEGRAIDLRSRGCPRKLRLAQRRRWRRLFQ